MSESYILATGEKAAKRLEFQNQLALEWSIDHLKKADIKEGMTVIDMGCGVGAMTTELAKLVGNTGKIYAVDASKEQLEIAKNKANSENLTNIEFIQADIYSLQEKLVNTADIIYMRYVLMHLTTPEAAVEVIKNYLKPNGVLASQESILKSFDLLSDHPEVVEKLGKLKGVDYSIGERTSHIFEQSGFKKVEVEYKQLKVNYDTFRKFILMSLSEWKDKAIDAGVIDNEKIKLWEEEINNLSGETEYSALAKQGYVLAWN